MNEIKIVSPDGKSTSASIEKDGIKLKKIQHIVAYINYDEVINYMYFYDSDGKQYKCILKNYEINGLLSEIKENKKEIDKEKINGSL